MRNSKSKRRKSPIESAKRFSVGTVKLGRDGYYWEVIKSKVKRWKKIIGKTKKIKIQKYNCLSGTCKLIK